LGAAHSLNRSSLWLALSIGPFCTATAQLSSYAVAGVACEQGYAVMQGITATGLALTVLACVWSWRIAHSPQPMLTAGEMTPASAMFMARFALLSNVFFVLVNTAFNVPLLLLHDCR